MATRLLCNPLPLPSGGKSTPRTSPSPFLSFSSRNMTARRKRSRGEQPHQRVREFYRPRRISASPFAVSESLRRERPLHVPAGAARASTSRLAQLHSRASPVPQRPRLFRTPRLQNGECSSVGSATRIADQLTYQNAICCRSRLVVVTLIAFADRVWRERGRGSLRVG